MLTSWQGVGELGQAGLHGLVPGGGDLSVLVHLIEFAAQVGEPLGGFACVSLVDFAADFLKFLRHLVGRFAVEVAGLPLLLDHAEERCQVS